MLKALSSLFVVAVLVAGASHPASAQGCAEGFTPISAKGKIFNNALSPYETLGVASVAIQGGIKLKCAVHGVASQTPMAQIDYSHTISCDDDLQFLGQTIHSRLTLHTTGAITGVEPHLIAFHETSVPDETNPGGGGLFAGVTDGQLDVDGTINDFGTIDMTFTGYFCLPD